MDLLEGITHYLKAQLGSTINNVLKTFKKIGPSCLIILLVQQLNNDDQQSQVHGVQEGLLLLQGLPKEALEDPQVRVQEFAL